MDKQIQKLKNLIEQNLYKSEEEINLTFGKPSKKFDEDIWLYSQYHYGFKNEISFVFEDKKVIDIMLTQYFLWIELWNIFHYPGERVEYKVIKLFWRT